MKNTIPLIIAVIFGLAAVLAVSRTLNQKEAGMEKTVEVLRVGNKDLKEKSELKVSRDCFPERIPVNMYIAGQHVRVEDANMVDGQTLNRDVQRGSFIMLGDFATADSTSSRVGTGEWMVPVHFADTALLNAIRPGDEIGILVCLRVQTKKDAVMLGDAPTVTEREEIRVLFPKKTVKEKIPSGVLLSLSREESMTLLAYQRVGDLYPVLRNPEDVSANTDLPAPLAADQALKAEV